MASASPPFTASDDAFLRAPDSTVNHVAEHTRRYIESDGEDGHLWNGIPTLVLLSKGRRSGDLRRNALIYGRDDATYVVVGSRGGHRNHPHWYLNLVEQPNASVQVGRERFGVLARTAHGAERTRLWDVMVDIFPTYDEYRQKTTREIPIVVLSLTSEEAGK